MSRTFCRACFNADLMAVVALLVLAGGVALTALTKIREVAARTGCSNNLGTIGKAVSQFADVNDGQLPYNQVRTPTRSWNVQVLPFIGKEKLARSFAPADEWWASAGSPNREIAGTRISLFQCPSTPKPNRMVKTIDPENDGGSFLAAPCDYVGSAGAYYQNNRPQDLHPGAMHHRTIDRRIRITDILDGTSHTLFVVEMGDKPNRWRAGKLEEDRSDKPQRPALAGQWAAPNWNHLRSYAVDGITQFGPCAVNCSNSASIYSFHEGGANVLLVDGSVRFLRSGMSQEMLIALVSYDGGELLSSNDF